MDALGRSLQQLGEALRDLFVALFDVIGPWLPLVIGLGVWIVYWTCAVNWIRLREVLVRGGWIGLLLIAFAAVLVWGTVDPPAHYAVRTADGRTLLGTSLAVADDGVTLIDAAGQTLTIPGSGLREITAYHRLLGLRVSNFVGKAVYVTALVCIMFLCGSVQLGGCCRVQDDEPVELHHAQAHAAAH
ncbi:MAG TPA: hypothetical protein VML55_05485 [Planctomycetaceae bacterium]|nr:hypothetical protein [Planctomycetaceae bacterium]